MSSRRIVPTGIQGWYPLGSTAIPTLSPDGTLVAMYGSGKEANKLVLRETRTGKKRAVVDIPPSLVFRGSAICAAVFSQDGQFVAVGTRKGLRSDKTTDGTCVLKLKWEGHLGPPCLDLSADGRLLSVVFDDHKNDGACVRVWNTVDGTLKHTFRSSKTILARARFSVDGKTLIYPTSEGPTHLWELRTGKSRGTLPNRKLDLNNPALLAMSRNGRQGVLWNYAKLSVWDWSTGKTTPIFPFTSDIRCTAFSPDGRTLATGQGCRLHLWDVRTGKEKSQSRGPELSSALAVSADGKLATTTDSLTRSRVHLWSIRDQKLLRSFGNGTNRTSLAFGPQGRLLVTGCGYGKLQLHDSKTGQKQWEVLAHFQPWGGKKAPIGAGVYDVDFSPDGKLVASCGGDARVCLWDAKNGKMLHTWKIKQEWATDVKFNDGGTELFAFVKGAKKHVVYVWDLKTHALLRRFDFPSQGSMLAAFSTRTNRFVVEEYKNGTGWLHFCDAKTGKVLTRVNAKEDANMIGGIQTIVPSPDGRILAVGSWEDLHLLDMKTHKVGRRIEGPFGGASSLAFTRDGRTLIAVHTTGTILFWDVSDQVK